MLSSNNPNPDAVGVTTSKESAPASCDKEEEEIKLLEIALLQQKGDPFVLLNYCKCLAQSLRKHIIMAKEAAAADGEQKGGLEVGFRNVIVKFGKKIFGNLSHMRNYLFKQFLKLFELDPTSLESNLGVAQICLLTLPFVARNYPLAKLCLERVLLFHPTSSKAITMMGFYLLFTEKNVPLARNHFENVNENDENHFKSTKALLYLSFLDVEGNKNKICSLVKEGLQNPSLSNEQIATLYFIRGLFSFFSAESERVVAISWIKAFKLCDKELERCMWRLPKIRAKYKFPEKYNEIFGYTNICAKLKESIDQHPDLEIAIVKKIRTIVKNAGRKEIKDKYKVRMKIDETENRKTTSSIFTPYPSLETLLVGSLNVSEVADAFKALGIKDNSPRPVVDVTYIKICNKFMEESHKETGKREAIDIISVNSAFGTLHRHFQRVLRTTAQEEEQMLKSDDVWDVL